MYYVIKGDPIPLSRARIGHGARHVYDCQREAKRICAIHIQNQRGEDPLVGGPIHLDITFFMRIPKVAQKNVENKRFQYHYYKPDISNLIKFLEDVSNRILFNDDSQIAYITARKVYDKEPRTEFSITPLKEKYQTP